MKLCGCKEPCFSNGETAWGHWGCVMCLSLSERQTELNHVSICDLTKEEVKPYCCEREYLELRRDKKD
jgi:hypothetical protein